MKTRWVVIAAVVLLALAFALWPEEEVSAPAPPSAELPTPPPASAPTTPSAPNDEAEAPAEEDAPEAEGPPGITVVVVQVLPCPADGGEPFCEEALSGVRVAVHDVEDGGVVAEGATAADGMLELPPLAAGGYEARVAEPGLLSEPQPFDVDGDSKTVVLVASRPARFELRVVSPSGQRVPHAVVELTFGLHFLHTGETDEAGVFRVPESASGEAELLVQAEGYAELRETFVVEGDVSRTVTLPRGREVTVHVARPSLKIPLSVTLSAGGDEWKAMTLHPAATSVRFTDLPLKPLMLLVTEKSTSSVGSLVERRVAVNESEVTVTLEGEPLDVRVEGPRPKSPFARGVCCAQHYVELRCEGRPERRKMLAEVPGRVTFPLVPAVPCWVAYDDGPEVRALPPEVTVRSD